MERSNHQVYDKARKLGVKYQNQQLWSKEEDQILCTYFPLEGIKCEKRFSRKRDSASRAAYLKISGPGHNCWTSEEDQILKYWYPKIGPSKIVEKFPNRPKEGIISRASFLGLRGIYKGKGTVRKILCVETNIVYNNGREANKAMEFKECSDRITYACRTGKTAGGYHWKYI